MAYTKSVHLTYKLCFKDEPLRKRHIFEIKFLKCKTERKLITGLFFFPSNVHSKANKSQPAVEVMCVFSGIQLNFLFLHYERKIKIGVKLSTPYFPTISSRTVNAGCKRCILP